MINFLSSNADLLLMISGVAFSLALIPQVLKGFKEKKCHVTLATSIPTFLFMLLTTVTLYSIDLILTAAIDLATTLMYMILVLQKLWWR